MIGKVLRGHRVQGLIRYLYGPGRFNEHRDPHIVAGFDVPAALEPALRPDGSRDFRRLDALLQQPLALLADRNYARPVWHLSVRAHPDDPVLSDQQWGDIARQIMDRTGLAPDGDTEAVRWIAVRHADDHIHIVATLARLDGTRPDVWNDGYRIRAACREIEEAYGLVRTAPADRTAARRPKRGETEKARRQHRPEPVRTTLRRQVLTAAAAAHDEQDFFDRLAAEGILVRIRFSRQDPDQRTGYAVALPGDTDRSGRPIWYSGGKLAPDLTLPKLRHRWTTHPSAGPATGPQSADHHPVTGRHLSRRTARAVLRTTVRQAADRSRTTEQFFDHLHKAGILVHRRHSTIDPAQITGYAVTLPDHTGPDRRPLWYSGGQLADDLTLPALQRRWAASSSPAAEPQPDLTAEERHAIYQDAARAAAHATAHIRRYAATNPYAAADACWAASDVLHVAAQATGNPHLRKAADAYDRAARPSYARLPRPTPAGNTLRTTARLLALTTGDRNTRLLITLLTSLAALIETIAQLRQTQQQIAQATAARTAYQHLHRAAPAGTPPWFGHDDQTLSAFQLAAADHPLPWRPPVPEPLTPTSRAASPMSPERRRSPTR
ncbi:relaxase/mobilization nuclease domain-containing protein [Thermomonospora cellulosilytica]|uniref:MobA/VirD2-like nuclease domain-containing protein n=1 Tax=Thermomonospora cellulosilytica TaxID=1411118 RepID=A0A7W3N495_9ACTN|nr:relaxase/mobilization nuclease domain-containing protein [Thermomonospora cellulosilytica]MBA9007265.1 hypothetical protein [Thermomonospora cellulosilytica]